MAKIKNNPKFKEIPEDYDGYEALSIVLMQQITSGAYAPGQKLEGARSLAAKYGVGRRVAVSALDALTIKGFLRAEPRRGFFVSDDIRPGRTYKLGIFLIGMQPFHCGVILAAANKNAIQYRYELVYGNDTEENCTLKRWLDRNREIDGLLVYGRVNNTLLKPLLSWKKPYVLIGHYGVDPIHPYADGDIEFLVEKKMTECLAPFSGKRFGALLGDKNSAADRLLMQAVRRAAKKVKCITDDSVLLHADGGGYALIHELFLKKNVDVFYTIGPFLVAAAQCADEHPSLKLPYIIGQAPVALPRGLVSVASEYLDPTDFDEHITADAVEKVMKLINQRNTKSNVA